jgi:hypothetical protein
VTFGLLAPTSTVVYASTSATQTIKPASYGQLTLEGAGPKRLGGNVLVNGNLQLSSAKLELEDFNATITKGSRVVGAGPGTYIVTSRTGRLRQSVLGDATEVVFPVGTATAYQPVSLRQSAARSEDVFAVRVTDEKYASYDPADTGIGTPVNEVKSVRKTWFVSEEVPGNANVSLQVQWKDTDQTTDFTAAQAYVSHFHNGFWDRTTNEIGAVLVPSTSDTYTLSRSHITSFSPFSVSSDLARPLPVTLVSFDAKRVGDVVNCAWVTATEKDNDHFDLERSLNGHAFSKLGTIKGAVTSSSRRIYSLQDQQPAVTTAYYRLRQVDTNGQSTYSPVVVVQGRTSALAVTVAPNPTTGPIALALTVAEATTIQGTVSTLLGNEVLHFAQPVSAGTQALTLDLSSQPAGMYLLRVRTPQGPQTVRVVKK